MRAYSISDSTQQGPVDTEDMSVEIDSDSDQSNEDSDCSRSVQTRATAGLYDESGEYT